MVLDSTQFSFRKFYYCLCFNPAFKLHGTAPEKMMESIHYPTMRTASKQGAGWPGLAPAWTREGFCQGFQACNAHHGFGDGFSCKCFLMPLKGKFPQAPPWTILHYNVVQEQDQQNDQCRAGKNKCCGLHLQMVWKQSVTSAELRRQWAVWAVLIFFQWKQKQAHNTAHFLPTTA